MKMMKRLMMPMLIAACAMNGCGGGSGGNLAGPVKPTGNAGKIVFVSYREGNNEIYIMNADGSGQKRLTNNSLDDSNPVLSPDRSKIVFSRTESGRNRTHLFVMNADGSGARQVTNYNQVDSEAKFSPDGRKIIFKGANFVGNDTPAQENIYTINVDGGAFTLIPNTFDQPQWPVYSPDGRHIIYTGIESPGGNTLFVINSDGREKRRITLGNYASFSPDGRTVVFSSPIDASFNENISTINFDGTGEKILVKSQGRIVGGARFSPFENKIVFFSYIGLPEDGMITYRIINADGTNEKSFFGSDVNTKQIAITDWR